jgi:hypothetical protein
MSSPYECYIREYADSLHQIAVWKPGSPTALGDFGELQDRQWVRLGSIWDLIPEPELSRLRTAKPSVSKPVSISFGRACLSKAQANTGVSGIPGKLIMAITFNERHSVFFRASKCISRSLTNTDAVVQCLWKLPKEKWRRSYRFVSEVSAAESFIVLVGGQAGTQATVSAESDELLNAFKVGTIKGGFGINFTGDTSLKILGGNGPYGMTLLGISAPWWKKDQPSAQLTHGMEGAVVDEVFPNPCDAEQFLREISLENT